MNESDHPSARICVGLVILSWFCAGLLTSLASFVLPQVDLILGEVLFILPAVFYVHRRGLSLSKTFRLNGIDKKMVGGFEAAMGAAGKSVEAHWYEADHAFANPTGSRYDAADAALAWERTLAFFNQHLS